MDGLVMAGQLILSLSIIVTLHEFGHFLAARMFGIKVEKFYLFFDAWGFKFFKIKKGETEYGIGWLPLGGYVKIAGMIDESMDKEAMKLPPQDYEFRSKPAWQRLIVMLGGVIMNFILGVIILTFTTLHYDKEYLPVESLNNGIYAYELGQEVGFKTGDKIIAINGDKVERFKDVVSLNNLMGSEVTVLRAGKEVKVTIPNDFYKTISKQGKSMFIGTENCPFVIDSVIENYPAAKAGIKKGDKIINVNNISILTFGDFKTNIQANKGKIVSLNILRNTDTINLSLPVDSNGLVGIVSSPPNYQLKKYNIEEGFKYGLSDGIDILKAQTKGFGKILTGKENAAESIQGPIGIATIYGGTWHWQRFWFLTAMISLVLGFMNILPIPALDGGHAIFLIFETITGRKFSDKFMERAQMVGMILLLALMTFAIGNDFWKHILN